MLYVILAVFDSTLDDYRGSISSRVGPKDSFRVGDEKPPRTEKQMGSLRGEERHGAGCPRADKLRRTAAWRPPPRSFESLMILFLLILVVAVSSNEAAVAQSQVAILEGAVHDLDGLPLAGVRIKAQRTDTNEAFILETDSSGT